MYQSESLLFSTLLQLAVIVAVARLANVGLRSLRATRRCRRNSCWFDFRAVSARLPFAERIRSPIRKGDGNTSWNYQPNWPNSPDVPDWQRVRVCPSCPEAKPVSGDEHRGGKYSRTAAAGESRWLVVCINTGAARRTDHVLLILGDRDGNYDGADTGENSTRIGFDPVPPRRCDDHGGCDQRRCGLDSPGDYFCSSDIEVLFLGYGNAVRRNFDLRSFAVVGRKTSGRFPVAPPTPSALTRTEDSQSRRTVASLLEWLGLSRFSCRLDIARTCKGSSRTEGVR